ncbi:MAG: putative patatin/cPLA2 family phospholipase [Acidimicrobiales bacterium]|jgi:predicted patatin/cPLA2 family phospholipase
MSILRALKCYNTPMKIGIVCSGGIMRCAYSAGALRAIYKHYGFHTPHVLVGASGSAGNCAYFISGQNHVGRTIWCDHLSEGKMISFLKRPFLSVDYLVNTVFREYEPLNVRDIQNSEINLVIPVTNIQTGQIEYVTNKCTDVDMHQLLIAAKTIPFASGKPTWIKGSSTDKYIDGDIAQELSQHVHATKKYNCDKILVIDNQQASSGLVKFFYLLHTMFMPRNVQRSMRRKIRSSKKDITSSETTIVMKPSQDLQMNGFTDTKEKLEHAYDLGYADACNHPSLQKLFVE